MAISVRNLSVRLIKPHLEQCGELVGRGPERFVKAHLIGFCALAGEGVANPQQRTGMGVHRWGGRRMSLMLGSTAVVVLRLIGKRDR